MKSYKVIRIKTAKFDNLLADKLNIEISYGGGCGTSQDCYGANQGCTSGEVCDCNSESNQSNQCTCGDETFICTCMGQSSQCMCYNEGGRCTCYNENDKCSCDNENNQDQCSCGSENDQCSCENMGGRCVACESGCQSICQVGSQSINDSSNLGSLSKFSMDTYLSDSIPYLNDLVEYINEAIYLCGYDFKDPTDSSRTINLTPIKEQPNYPYTMATTFNDIRLLAGKFQNIILANKVAGSSVMYYSDYSDTVDVVTESSIPNSIPCCQDTNYQNCISRQNNF